MHVDIHSNTIGGIKRQKQSKHLTKLVNEQNMAYPRSGL